MARSGGLPDEPLGEIESYNQEEKGVRRVEPRVTHAHKNTTDRETATQRTPVYCARQTKTTTKYMAAVTRH